MIDPTSFLEFDKSRRALLAAPRSLHRRVLRRLPGRARKWLSDQRRRWAVFPPYGFVRLGSLHRVVPISSSVDGRGTPIDRYYIDRSESHADDIHGRVLECYDRDYTMRLGAGRVASSDVLNIEGDNRNSTFIGDLAGINNFPSEAFDSIIVTQVFQYVYDLRAAIATLQRIAKPGGVILATVPGITPLHSEPWPWMWSLTTVSAERLFGVIFSCKWN